jgi:hypothetical protein
MFDSTAIFHDCQRVAGSPRNKPDMSSSRRESRDTLTYTGLRISDVALFDIQRLHGNEVFLRAKKNGGDVFAYVPNWLRDRLLQRAKVHGPMIFMSASRVGSRR